METLNLTIDESGLDFNLAKRMADSAADEKIDEPILLSWYDKPRDIESPAGVSECHIGCSVRGCVDYAANRGGTLTVDINNGMYLFCYMPMSAWAG